MKNYEDMSVAELQREEVQLVHLADGLVSKIKPYTNNRETQHRLEDAEDKIALVRFLITGEIQP